MKKYFRENHPWVSFSHFIWVTIFSGVGTFAFSQLEYQLIYVTLVNCTTAIGMAAFIQMKLNRNMKAYLLSTSLTKDGMINGLGDFFYKLLILGCGGLIWPIVQVFNGNVSVSWWILVVFMIVPLFVAMCRSVFMYEALFESQFSFIYILYPLMFFPLMNSSVYLIIGSLLYIVGRFLWKARLVRETFLAVDVA